ncbi:MAG TPA: hypothetical protein DCP91_08990 [Eggerthellaceae bacterium]|nr:hypothetical protein [Eggerthellaceae bacterium]
MNTTSNIVIADESALHVYLHCGGLERIGAHRTLDEPLSPTPLDQAAIQSVQLDHPLYGDAPVKLLTGSMASRRKTQRYVMRCCSSELPSKSFVKLKEGLYLASPELVFARMASFVSEAKLALIGIDLCARYYIRTPGNEICDRDRFATTPAELADYLKVMPNIAGTSKARRALGEIAENSGSPLESKMFLQFSSPMRKGGFALPFTHMNYDVRAGRLAHITEQGDFCIDLVNPAMKIGVEYDGEEHHGDASRDKRRRNGLASLGYTIFPIDKSVLFDPEATEKAAYQIAQRIGRRIRKPKNWEAKYAELRTELGLPT